MNITELPKNARYAYDEIDEILKQPTPRKIPRSIVLLLRPPIFIAGVINLMLGVIALVILVVLNIATNMPLAFVALSTISLLIGAIFTGLGAISVARKIHVLSRGIRGRCKITSISALPYHASGEGFFMLGVITNTGDECHTIVSSYNIRTFMNIADSEENSPEVVYIPGKKLCVLPLALALRMQYKNFTY